MQHHFLPPFYIPQDRRKKNTQVQLLYDGSIDTNEHINICVQCWKLDAIPPQLWVHHFIHSFQAQFCQYFYFKGKTPRIIVVL